MCTQSDLVCNLQWWEISGTASVDGQFCISTAPKIFQCAVSDGERSLILLAFMDSSVMITSICVFQCEVLDGERSLVPLMFMDSSVIITSPTAFQRSAFRWEISCILSVCGQLCNSHFTQSVSVCSPRWCEISKCLILDGEISVTIGVGGHLCDNHFTQCLSVCSLRWCEISQCLNRKWWDLCYCRCWCIAVW